MDTSAGTPNILQTSPLSGSNRKSFFRPRNIFIVLGILILIELFIGFRSLNLPFGSKEAKPIQINQTEENKIAPTGGGKIVLVSDKTQYGVGQTVVVDIREFTGGRPTDGTDVILQFDPSKLEAASDAVVVGSIYSVYPVKEVDSKSGTIRISGISSVGQTGFNGMGSLAKVNFKAKELGVTAIKVQFVKDQTNDSNIIEAKSANDLLTDVLDLNISIGNQAAANPTSGSCSQRVYGSCVDSDGSSGSFWCSNITDPFSCQIGCFKEQGGSEQGCKVTVTK